MTAPLAVLILFFEKPEQTIECIESVRPAGIPLYVLNNGSSAAAARAVKAHAAAHPKIQILDSATNSGPAAGRNALIERTREPWILLLDNDAAMATPDWPDRFERERAAHPDAQAFVPRLRNVHEGGFVEPVRVDIDGGIIRQRPAADAETNVFPGTGVFVERALFDRWGLFDPALFSLEELELAIRALKAGAPLKVRRLDTVEIKHDHRRAAGAADRDAVRERYDGDRNRRSLEHLLRKHGLRWGGPAIEPWLAIQRASMTGGWLSRLYWALRRWAARRKNS